MSVPIPTRFTADEIAMIDRLVAEGVGRNRSDVIRRAVDRLDEAMRRTRVGDSIAASYRELPQSTDDDVTAMANALAMTEAEPW